ncbi:DUF397 domain-containing protein [Thermomonospora umbrina]|uniref:Uncharacterized protein DUF397 n=1 Tax=Thermomonospora umbrina TaxID=111806 RepID=A0A3D9SP76_9ACTN|nr:DUF397 domain-containing protein [Thermomonospora umbrina]REE95763.1 uncharacterized protein DUF397 [Thermomonospora umbrina]
MTDAAWRKSSRSTEGTSAQCVEVGRLAEVIGVRDSKRPEVGHFTLPRERFAGFVQRIKDDTLDL